MKNAHPIDSLSSTGLPAGTSGVGELSAQMDVTKNPTAADRIPPAGRGSPGHDPRSGEAGWPARLVRRGLRPGQFRLVHLLWAMLVVAILCVVPGFLEFLAVALTFTTISCLVFAPLMALVISGSAVRRSARRRRIVVFAVCCLVPLWPVFTFAPVDRWLPILGLVFVVAWLPQVLSVVCFWFLLVRGSGGHSPPAHSTSAFSRSRSDSHLSR